jgi:hypothetical protein
LIFTAFFFICAAWFQFLDFFKLVDFMFFN